MKNWEIIDEETNIVLVGKMSPIIFHPEWFINKGIVSSWDYDDGKNINSHDISQVNLPNDRVFSVVKNKIVLKTSRASEFRTLSDIIVSIFKKLQETDTTINQLGMNYIAKIKISSTDQWINFGKKLAIHKTWTDSVDYLKDLNEDKLKSFGLLEILMSLPRPDDYNGHIRPKIEVDSINDRVVAFSINNHINIDESSSNNMITILENNWTDSITLAENMIKNIMCATLEK